MGLARLCRLKFRAVRLFLIKAKSTLVVALRILRIVIRHRDRLVRRLVPLLLSEVRVHGLLLISTQCLRDVIGFLMK